MKDLLSSLDFIGARHSRHVEALFGQVQLAAVGQGLVALIARRLQPLHTALQDYRGGVIPVTPLTPMKGISEQAAD